MEFESNASQAKKFAHTLEEYIKELKKNNSGSRIVVVENGKKISFDGGNNVYQFPFRDEIDVFQGAGVRAIVGQSSITGRLVNLEFLRARGQSLTTLNHLPFLPQPGKHLLVLAITLCKHNPKHGATNMKHTCLSHLG